MIPLVALMCTIDGSSIQEALIDRRCVALSSPDLRRQVVAPSLEREIVLVPTTLGREDAVALAASLHAELTNVDGRWRITRSGATSRSLREADRTFLKSQIDEATARMDALFKRYEKSSVVEAPYEAMRAAQAQFQASIAANQLNAGDSSGFQACEMTPVSRLLVETIKRLSEEDLLDVRPGQVTVFSNVPVGTERPLLRVEKEIQAYVAAQERFARWSEEAVADKKIPDAYRWAFPKGEFRSGRRTLQLWIDRSEPDACFSLEVFDPAGAREANSILTIHGYEGTASPQRRDKAELGRVSLPNETIVAMARATPGERNFKSGYLDPVAHEPLDLLVGDALCLWAKAKGRRQVVACVPDALLQSVDACLVGNILDLDALSRAIDEASLESIMVGKTLVVRPKNPLQEEAMRIDRRPLSALVQKAIKGNVDVDDLFAFHRAYLEEYERRPIVQRLERRIVEAFGLASPNWNQPHAILGLMGTLSRTQRRQLELVGKLSLDSRAFSSCLLPLARQASRYDGQGSDIERTFTRLAASQQGRWLEAFPGPSSILVRRVSKGHAEVTRVDQTTGESKLEKGNNLVLDRTFVPLSMVRYGGQSEDHELRYLDSNYKFLWIQERRAKIRVIFGSVAQVGPITIRQRFMGSSTPVGLRQIPNLSFLPSEP